MLSAEMLALLGGGALLPYVAEALWSLKKARRGHKCRASELSID